MTKKEGIHERCYGDLSIGWFNNLQVATLLNVVDDTEEQQKQIMGEELVFLNNSDTLGIVLSMLDEYRLILP